MIKRCTFCTFNSKHLSHWVKWLDTEKYYAWYYIMTNFRTITRLSFFSWHIAIGLLPSCAINKFTFHISWKLQSQLFFKSTTSLTCVNCLHSTKYTYVITRKDIVVWEKISLLWKNISLWRINYLVITKKNLIKTRKDIVITGKDPYNGAFHCSTLSLKGLRHDLSSKFWILFFHF